jgi:Tfp pilus assembly protein PilO
MRSRSILNNEKEMNLLKVLFGTHAVYLLIIMLAIMALIQVRYTWLVQRELQELRALVLQEEEGRVMFEGKDAETRGRGWEGRH